MNYRQAVILDAETSTTAGTKTIDLKGLDPMSQLIITKSGLNSTNTPTAHPAKMVTKIEIVDGSEILWSLSGIEAQALDYHQREKPSASIISYLNDTYCRALFNINFGRWLWDEDLAFDPSRFKNPQLKITHDGDAGGGAPDANTLSVVGMMFDERKIMPQAYLMAKEHYTYSLTSSAKEKLDLPTDYPLKSLTIQSLSDGKAINAQYNKIKLHENNNKKVVIEDSVSSLIKYLTQDKEPYTENIFGYTAGSTVEFFVTPTYETYGVGNMEDQSAAYVTTLPSYGGTWDVKTSGAGTFNAIVRGLAPHGAMYIPFADPWEVGMYYDVTKLAKLELEITAGSSVGSSSTCQVITEQLKRY